MFIHDSHLPQVLTADCYYSREHYEKELTSFFLPGWHVVGTVGDLPRDGDFLTVELFGRPLIVWRNGGQFHTFLNVCAHRFSTLTHAPCGHMPTLTCQYHGWEYDEAGNTRRIPDARSFRPLHDGQVALTKFRTTTCGQVIFVALTEHAPELSSFLGSGYEICEELIGLSRTRVMTLDWELEANWKVKVENSLESYHVDTVHRRTFRTRPPAEACEHVLADHWSLFKTNQPAVSRLHRWLDSVAYPLMGLKHNIGYEHYLFLPNLMLGRAGRSSWIEVVRPLTSTRCRLLFALFVESSRNRNPLAMITSRIMARGAARFTRLAMSEDVAVMPGIQKGLESCQQPSTGLISIREERVFHFQRCIQAMTEAGVEGQST